MSDLPQWWNEHIEAAWQRSREAAIGDWNVRGDRAPIDSTIVEHALAFGHGARSAYPDRMRWEAVAGQLAADWDHLGNVGPAAWAKIAHIVQHEWQRAAGPDGDAPPEAS